MNARGKRQTVATPSKRGEKDIITRPMKWICSQVIEFRLPGFAACCFRSLFGEKEGRSEDQAGAIPLVLSEASRADILRQGIRAARGIHSRQRMSSFLRTTRAKMRSDSSFSLGSATLSSRGVKQETMYLILPFVTIPTSFVQVSHQPVLW